MRSARGRNWVPINTLHHGSGSTALLNTGPDSYGISAIRASGRLAVAFSIASIPLPPFGPRDERPQPPSRSRRCEVSGGRREFLREARCLVAIHDLDHCRCDHVGVLLCNHNCVKHRTPGRLTRLSLCDSGVLVISTLCIMLFFHLKKKKRDQREDLDDQFQMSDYGLDEGQMPAGRAKQPRGPQRLSFDDLPRPGGPPTRNPFSDDAVSDRSHEGLNPPNAPWPKRADSSESGQSNGAPLK